MTETAAEIGALLKKAYGLQRSQQLPAAIAIYRRVIEKDRNNFDALQLIGLCLYQLGQLDDALANLNKALSIRQDVASVFNHRGIVLRALGRNVDAIEDFDKAIGLEPLKPDVHFNKSNALRDQKNLEEARRCLERAIEIDPRNFHYLNNLAGVLEESGLSQEALACFDRLVTLQPSNPDAHVNRARVLHKLNRTDEAIVSCDKAIALSPGLADAHTCRGNALLGLNRLDEALVSYDRAIWSTPEDPIAFRNRGRVLVKLNRIEQALASYDEAIRLKPDCSESLYARGVALQKLNRLQDALADLNHAIDITHDKAEILRRRGDVLREMRLFQQARASLELAAGINPSLAPIYSSLGRVFADQENWERAREEYEAALRIEPGLRAALTGLSLLPPAILTPERAAELLSIVETVDYTNNPAVGLFTKARLLETLHRYDEGFEYIRKANHHRLATIPSAKDEQHEKFGQLRAELQSWMPVAHPARLGDNKKLIVILGPSRSGKTSLERLLSRDGRFFRGFESGDARLAVRRLTDLQRQKGMARETLEREVLRAIFPFAGIESGHDVLTITNPYMLPGAHKIHDLYTNSFFVFLERDPLDNAVEIFRKDYKSTSSFSCSPESAFSHVLDYLEVTRELETKMKGKCLRIRYDDLLRSPKEIRNTVYSLLGLDVPVDESALTDTGGQRDPKSPYREMFSALLASSRRPGTPP